MHRILKLGWIVALAAVVALPVGAEAAKARGRKIQAVVDGETTKDMRVYAFSGNHYFSIKDIAALYGAHLTWKSVSGKATLQLNNESLNVSTKSTRVSYGDVVKRLSLPTRYIGGILYVPAALVQSSAFSEFAQADTTWNDDAGILTVEHQATVAAPRYYTRGETTRIIIEMLEDLPFEWTQKSDTEAALTFSRGRIRDGKVAIGNALVDNIEMKQQGRNSTVTIRLASPAAVAEYKQDGSKIVVTVRAATASADTAVASDDAPPAAVRTAAATGRKKLIVLDAGHGGEDPGAVGPTHTREKDINLLIVKELKNLFENDGGFDVILSRTDDTFIPLVERTTLANEKKADLFVSVHCNADFPRSSSGFEIYFLSEKASDKEAAATAMLENAVVELEGKPTQKRAMLQDLLWSLMVNEFINESSELCSLITGEVTHRIKIENRGVKQAGFYVLRGAEMPAVLVECAFLSNVREEARLRTRKFQSQIADAIYEGVKDYVSRKDIANARLKNNIKSE